MQNAFALTVLIFVGVAGSVPFIIGMMDPESAGTAFNSAYDVVVREPMSSVVFAVLFGVGAVMCLQITKPVFAILLLPSLFAAVWPMFRFDAAILPVPTGAIVAFAAEHPSAPNDNMGCPIGWKHHAELAGRVPLGAGQGVANPDGQTPGDRTLGEALGGAESVLLSEDHIPPHTHGDGNFNALLQDSRANRRTVGVKADSNGAGREPDVYAHGRLQNFGRGQPHENMPPYKVVVFCEYTGDIQEEGAVASAATAPSQ